MDDVDLEIISEWLALGEMVAEHSTKFREDLERVLANWRSIVDREVRMS